MCNSFFCHYVFKKPSAAEASESVYMRERVNSTMNELIALLMSEDEMVWYDIVDTTEPAYSIISCL